MSSSNLSRASRYYHNALPGSTHGVKYNEFGYLKYLHGNLILTIRAFYDSDAYYDCKDLKMSVFTHGTAASSALVVDAVQKFFWQFSAFLHHGNIALCNGKEKPEDYDPEYSLSFGD